MSESFGNSASKFRNFDEFHKLIRLRVTTNETALKDAILLDGPRDRPCHRTNKSGTTQWRFQDLAEGVGGPKGGVLLGGSGSTVFVPHTFPMLRKPRFVQRLRCANLRY